MNPGPVLQGVELTDLDSVYISDFVTCFDGLFGYLGVAGVPEFNFYVVLALAVKSVHIIPKDFTRTCCFLCFYIEIGVRDFLHISYTSRFDSFW